MNDTPHSGSFAAAPFAALQGRWALVTGASSGIGRAIALELAAAGASLVLVARRSREALEQVASEVRACHVTAETVLQDISEAEQLAPFVERMFQTHPQLEFWVNNAGVDLLTGSARQWDYATKLQALWETDVRGSILLSRLAGQKLKTLGRGVILNIGWDQAETGMDGDSGELFAAAKGAIMCFSRSLAVSLAPQVRVHCIAPGWIRTAWGETASDLWQERVMRETPLKRWGEPADIARLARFLLSDEAAYLTGQIWNANGGAVR